MEGKVSLRQELPPEKSSANKYLLFDEKTINFFLYGSKDIRVIDVNKLKRKAENDPEPSSSKTDLEEPRLTNAIRSFPDEVQLCVSSIPGASYGVCAREHIPLGTWIGPYEGRRVPPQRLSPDIDSAHLWEIFKDGNLSHFLDGSDEENSSWMRFIRCARHIKEQNLYAFQYCGNIFYRAFKEIPPGKELLVWYDDKYPQYHGIPLVMQDYEFRESAGAVNSSSSRGLRKISSTTTQANSSEQDPKKYGHSRVSRENPHSGSFRVPSTRALQPRLVRPTGNVGNLFSREQPGPQKRGVPRFTETFRGEVQRTQKSAVPTSADDGKSLETFNQGSLPSSSNFHLTQIKSKDLPKTKQFSTTSLLSKTPEYASSKQVVMSDRKESSSINNRDLLQRTISAPEVTSAQLIDNDRQNSPHTSERRVVKSGNTPERPIPALHPHLPQATPLHSNANQMHYEQVRSQTSGISLEEFGMWRCRQCLKTFTQRVTLQMHECTQTPERPYQCGQCSLSFSTPSELRSHVELHTNDKLYKCGFCSRTFSGATTLNNHIRTHTGEKPFICTKCNTTFSQANQLARHQRVPGECIKH